MKKNYNRPATSSRKKLRQYLPLIIVGAVLLLLVAGMTAALWLSQRSQELRQQASVEGGLVEMQLTAEPTALTAGELTKLHLSVNTNQVLVDGIQLFMNLDMPTLPPTNEVSIQVDESTGLQLAASKVEVVNNRLQIQLIAISSQTAQPFSAAEMMRFVTISFTPPSSGQLRIEFDNTLSKSTVYQSDPVEDELATLNPVTLTVNEAQETLPTASPVPTATPGSGGDTGKSCNENCRDNDECGANLFCNQNKCRSPYHPDSTTCSAPADQGLSRSCNQYCADNRECQTGLTCYYNRCRHPQNVFSEQCSVASPTPTPKSNSGGTTATKTPTRTPTPKTSIQPTVTTSEYLQNLNTQNQVNNVFNTPDILPSPTPGQHTQIQPTPVTMAAVTDDKELDPNQKLFLLVGGVGGALLLILFLPLLFALLSRKNKKVKPINGGLEKLITNASQQPPISDQSSQDLLRFAGSVEARKPKEEEKPPTGLSSS